MKPIRKGGEYDKNKRENKLRAIRAREVGGGEFSRVKNGLSRFPAKLQVLWKKVK